MTTPAASQWAHLACARPLREQAGCATSRHVIVTVALDLLHACGAVDTHPGQDAVWIVLTRGPSCASATVTSITPAAAASTFPDSPATAKAKTRRARRRCTDVGVQAARIPSPREEGTELELLFRCTRHIPKPATLGPLKGVYVGPTESHGVGVSAHVGLEATTDLDACPIHPTSLVELLLRADISRGGAGPARWCLGFDRWLLRALAALECEFGASRLGLALLGGKNLITVVAPPRHDAPLSAGRAHPPRLVWVRHTVKWVGLSERLLRVSRATGSEHVSHRAHAGLL